MAKSTDMKVRRRTHIGYKSTLSKFRRLSKVTPISLTWLDRGTDAPATTMEVRSLSDFTRGLVPKQIASVLDGLRTRPL